MDDSLKSLFKPPVEPDDERRGPPARFHLTTSNQWFLVFVAACFVAMRFWKSEEPSSSDAGYVVGTMFGTVVFSALIAWIAFRLSGRSVLVGSIAFNGMLILCLVGQIVPFMKQMQQTTVGGVSHIGPRSGDADRNNRELRETLTGLMIDHARESSAITEEWKGSWNRMVADINFNYSTKPDDAELKRRRGHFIAHARVVKKLLAFHDDTIPKLHRRCADLPRNDEVVKFLDKVAEEHKLASARFKPLLDAHLTTAEMLVAMTNLLIDNPKGWTVNGETIVFDDEPLSKRYGELAEVFKPAIQRADERAEQLR